MRLLLIEGERPSKWTIEDMPRHDENFIYIPIWFIYYISEKYNVSEQSTFWHVLNHEILHINYGHIPYPDRDTMKSEQDFQKFANYFRKIERQAIPEPIDDETKILSEAMRHLIEDDIRHYHKIFQNGIRGIKVGN